MGGVWYAHAQRGRLLASPSPCSAAANNVVNRGKENNFSLSQENFCSFAINLKLVKFLTVNAAVRGCEVGGDVARLR